MSTDMGWHGDRIQPLVDQASRDDAVWIEFAHTPQLPHMGLVRVFLVAARAAAESNATLVYCVNDHLWPQILAESRYLPFIGARGPVAKPPRFGPSKSHSKWAMHALPSPREELGIFVERWRELDPSRAKKIELLGARLLEIAEQTKSYAAWLTRSTLDLLGIPAVVFPTSKWAQVFNEAMPSRLVVRGWAVDAITGARWGRWPADEPLEPERYRPSVELRQTMMNRVKLHARVCGALKKYQNEADALSRSVWGLAAPHRMHIDGTTRLSLGRDSGAHERVNLLQALSSDWTPSLLQLPRDNSSEWAFRLQ